MLLTPSKEAADARAFSITGGIATERAPWRQCSRVAPLSIRRRRAVARAAVVPLPTLIMPWSPQFGTKRVLRDDGTLDRRALGALVFRDAEARRRLRKDHPSPRGAGHSATACRMARQPSPPRLVDVGIPATLQSRLEEMVDTVVVVSSEQTTQLQRLITRTGLAPEERAMLRCRAVPLV